MQEWRLPIRRAFQPDGAKGSNRQLSIGGAAQVVPTRRERRKGTEGRGGNLSRHHSHLPLPELTADRRFCIPESGRSRAAFLFIGQLMAPCCFPLINQSRRINRLTRLFFAGAGFSVVKQ